MEIALAGKRSRKLGAALALYAILLLNVSNAHAGIYCVGTVKNVYSRVGGLLGFKAGYRGDYVTLCNVQTSWNGIAPEQCRSWYAILLTAQTTGGVISVFYPAQPSVATR